MPKSPTILVFDSGLGGMTVLREIVAARPDARYIYVADDAFFPYGHHTEQEIIARVVPLIGELIDRHTPDLAVIACNTASTLVMSYLRQAYKIPFVGTVPAIKPACARSKTKRVSVLGTKGTVQREYTKRADDGKVLAQWTDSIGRPWFEVENAKFHVRGYVVTSGMDAWIIYAGYRMLETPEPEEIALAGRSLETILPIPRGEEIPPAIPDGNPSATTGSPKPEIQMSNQ